MRYPWELLRDRHGWLVEQFAIGRQVIAEAGRAPRWSSNSRQGPLRLLVVAPSVPGNAGGAGGRGQSRRVSTWQSVLRGCSNACRASSIRRTTRSASISRSPWTSSVPCFDRASTTSCTLPATAGTIAVNPDRSCWMFTDGPLYAFELQQTLANADVRPWLIYGSACEGAQDGAAPQSYHDGVYGMATAALSQGVAAYVGPLWKISDTDAKNMAAAFYEALLITPHESRRSAGPGASEREGRRTRPRRARHENDGNRLEPGNRYAAKCGMGRHGAVWRPDANRATAAKSIGHERFRPEDAYILITSTSSFTAAADLLSAACSSASRGISMICSMPFAPSLTGTPRN